MATMVFHPTLDGYVRHLIQAGGTWADVRDGAGNGSLDRGSIFAARIRSDLNINEWERIDRSIFLFDTSPIPDGATILSVTFSVYGKAKSEIGFSPSGAINVYTSNPASDDELVGGDYDSLGEDALSDPISQADFVVGGRNYFALSPSVISETRIIKLGLREANYDAPGIEPTWHISAWSYFDIYGIEYGIAVTTNPATLIGLNEATLNGAIGSDYMGPALTVVYIDGVGGKPYTCGFDYGLTTGYGSTAMADGTYDLGESFSKAITGLDAGTLYHFTSIAVHGSMIEYDSDRTFTTDALPVVVGRSQGILID